MRQFLDIEENRVWTLEDLKSLFDYKIKHDQLIDQCNFEEWLEDNLVENKGFLVGIKHKKYYVEKYMEKMNKCPIFVSFDLTANTDEVVGYYLDTYKNEALNAWNYNVEYLKINGEMTEQELRIDIILNVLCN